MARRVVVGFDGSAIGRATLAYAARRSRRGDRLVVGHVLEVAPVLLESPYFDSALERSREHGRRVLDEAKGALPANTPADMRLIEGPSARALVDLAREVGAEELAVGSRGFGAFRAAALGSTSHALLHEADRPIVIVPSPSA
jgi:nucleotide-binding universal stress UspA family protein